MRGAEGKGVREGLNEWDRSQRILRSTWVHKTTSRIRRHTIPIAACGIGDGLAEIVELAKPRNEKREHKS